MDKNSKMKGKLLDHHDHDGVRPLFQCVWAFVHLSGVFRSI
jgi:hypothetical protein